MTQEEYNIQDILKSIAELRYLQEQDHLQSKENEKKMFEGFAETRLQMQETDRKMNMIFETTGLQMQETDRKLDKVAKQLGGIAQNTGDMAEEFFYRSLQKKLEIAGTKYDDIGRNWFKSRNGLKEEFDIILTNGKVLEIVEVKYKVHPEDLQKLERKYHNFKKLFPIYDAFEVRGAIAGMSVPEEVIYQAKAKGFHALVAKGDHIEEA